MDPPTWIETIEINSRPFRGLEYALQVAKYRLLGVARKPLCKKMLKTAFSEQTMGLERLLTLLISLGA